jgi:hypothetical protein
MTAALTAGQLRLLNRVLLAGELILNDRARSQIEGLEAAGLVTVHWDMNIQVKGSGTELTGRNTVRPLLPGAGTPGDPWLIERGVLDLSELRAHFLAMHRRAGRTVPRSNEFLAAEHAREHHRYRCSHVHEGPYVIVLRDGRRPLVQPRPLGWFTGQQPVTHEEVSRRFRERISGQPEDQEDQATQEELDRRAEQAFESRYQVARGPFADND